MTAIIPHQNTWKKKLLSVCVGVPVCGGEGGGQLCGVTSLFPLFMVLGIELGGHQARLANALPTEWFFLGVPSPSSKLPILPHYLVTCKSGPALYTHTLPLAILCSWYPCFALGLLWVSISPSTSHVYSWF